MIFDSYVHRRLLPLLKNWLQVLLQLSWLTIGHLRTGMHIWCSRSQGKNPKKCPLCRSAWHRKSAAPAAPPASPARAQWRSNHQSPEPTQRECPGSNRPRPGKSMGNPWEKPENGPKFAKNWEILRDLVRSSSPTHETSYKYHEISAEVSRLYICVASGLISTVGAPITGVRTYLPSTGSFIPKHLLLLLCCGSWSSIQPMCRYNMI